MWESSWSTGGTNIAMLDVVTATSQAAPVLNDDVLAAPVLEFRA